MTMSWIDAGVPPSPPPVAWCRSALCSRSVSWYASGRRRMPDRSDVPATDGGSLVKVDAHDLARTGQAHVVLAVEVEVEPLGRVQPSCRRIRQVLRRDQVLERRGAHVADVDPAEQPVPIA